MDYTNPKTISHVLAGAAGFGVGYILSASVLKLGDRVYALFSSLFTTANRGTPLGNMDWISISASLSAMAVWILIAVYSYGKYKSKDGALWAFVGGAGIGGATEEIFYSATKLSTQVVPA